MEEFPSSTQPPPIVVGTGDRRESALPVEETSERISVSSAPSLGIGILQDVGEGIWGQCCAH